MILSRLKEYADTRMDLPPAMYGETPVRWFVDIGSDGTLEGFTSRGGDTKAKRRGEVLRVPQLVRSVGISPKLLADNGEYTLGIGRQGADEAKVAERHRLFVALVRRCAEETDKASVRAVVQFLEGWAPDRDRGLLPDGFDPADTLTFRVGGVLPVDLESVQTFWADDTAGPEGRTVMTCLVTGEAGPVEERLPVKIKGLPEGQKSGTSLVSANAVPFTSYGLKYSLTSPISRNAGERFAKALNFLISDGSSRMYVGPTVYVFWTRKETGFDYLQFVEQPKPQAVKELFQSPHTTRVTHDLKEDEFYALALSASGARAVVRDWLETTIPEVEESLKRWLEGQRIVDAYGKESSEYLGVGDLARATVQRKGETNRDAEQRVQPALGSALVRVAIKGGRLPEDLLARVVRRNRAEGGVTRPRAALIKLVFATQGGSMTEMQSLNPNPDLTGDERSAYHCGRLLAEVEAVQRAALGQVNASVTDRYYGSASSTPASAFPSLMRGVRANLGNLRRKAPGTHATLDARIMEIASHLPDFPKVLTMRSQGLFALGYYHQRAKDRADAQAAREARNGKKEES